jgi:hypothetical protein
MLFFSSDERKNLQETMESWEFYWRARKEDQRSMPKQRRKT